jgi:tetratricopeptide (TPR) repeat protein
MQELDWIVMKALAKEREQRYQTAGTLAEDVQHFLNNEPVLAGPPTVTYRLRKFIRRHRGRVLAGGMVILALVVGAIGMTIGMFRAWQAESRLRTSLANESKSRDRARVALNAMNDDVIEKLFAQRASLSNSEKAYLRKVLQHYEEYAREQGQSEDARAVAAEGQFRVAKLRAFLGERPEAEESYRTASTRYDGLVRDFPTNPHYRQALAASQNNLGVLLVELGKYPEAEAAYERSLELRQALVSDFANVPQYQRELAMSFNNQGVLLREQKKLPQAIAAIQRALVIRELLAAAQGSQPESRQDLAGSQLNLGIVLKDMAQLDDAKKSLQSAIAIQDKLVADYPEEDQYRRDLGLSHDSLGIVLVLDNRRTEAEASFRAALQAREKLTADFPGCAEYQLDLVGSYINLGRVILANGKANESLSWFNKAVVPLNAILKKDSRLATARQFMRNACASRAEALVALKRYAEAAKDWDMAQKLDSGAMKSQFRFNRAEALCRSGNHQEAAAAADELTKEPTITPGGIFNLGCIMAICASKTDDNSLRDAYSVKAVALLERAKAVGLFNDAKLIEQLQSDKDLDAVRQRDDFRKLLSDVETGK